MSFDAELHDSAELEAEKDKSLSFIFSTLS